MFWLRNQKNIYCYALLTEVLGVNLTLCMLGNILHDFFCHLIFFKINLFKGCHHAECQRVWIQIRLNVFSKLVVDDTSRLNMAILFIGKSLINRNAIKKLLF